MAGRVLHGLDAKEYEHPFDKKALEALHGTPGLELIFKKINEFGIEKMYRIQYTGSNLRVNPTNFPDLYATFEKVCTILDLGFIPDLYVQWNYSINAMAIGAVNPMIVINSGCIDLLSEEELMFLLGHEAGHLKSNHQLYHQMASVLPIVGNIIGNATLGLGEMLSQGVVLALLYWQRMSEFTADRAGFLACQNSDAAVQATMKMAGMPLKYFNAVMVDEFIRQAKEFDDYDYNALNLIAKTYMIMQQNHPWTVMRAAEFFKWLDSGQYQAIFERGAINMKNQLSSSGNRCIHCGGQLASIDKFCTHCGAKISYSE